MNSLPRSGNAVRLTLLGIVLLVVLVGAIWEFGMTLPGFKRALDNLDVVSKAHANDPKSRADITQQLGDATSSSYRHFELSTGEAEAGDAGEEQSDKTVRHRRIDRYVWNRIIPGRDPLEVLVVYDRLVSGDEVDSFDPESCPDDQWVFQTYYEPGNQPVDASVQGKSGVTAEKKFFSNNDADSDGFLSESEIPLNSSLLKRMEMFDPNGDQKISFEEFEKGIEQMEKEMGRQIETKDYDLMYGGASPTTMASSAGTTDDPQAESEPESKEGDSQESEKQATEPKETDSGDAGKKDEAEAKTEKEGGDGGQ